MNELHARTLELEVQGRGLDGPRLGDSLDPAGTLLVFLRHFG